MKHKEQIPLLKKEYLYDLDENDTPDTRKLSQLQEINEQYTSFTSLHSLQSISGPIDKPSRIKFYVTLCVMFISGSSAVFLVSLLYQEIGSSINGLKDMKIYYWAIYLITFGAFFSPCFAIFSPNGFKDFGKINGVKDVVKILVPATMDVIVSGGRYIALIFLPATFVTILNASLQLGIFRLLRNKYLGKSQILGLVITVIGIVIVSVQALLKEWDCHLISHVIGICLMIILSLLAAIKIQISEILIKDFNFNSDFIVGFKSILSMVWILIIGLFLFFYSKHSFNELCYYIREKYYVFITYVLFVVCIFFKDVTQMGMIKLSSSVTGKLFQQFYPLFVLFESLFFYYAINNNFGQEFNVIYSPIQILGCIIIVCGTYIYIKHPNNIKILLNNVSNWVKKHCYKNSQNERPAQDILSIVTEETQSAQS